MAREVELQRLIVRLRGEAAQYESFLKKAKADMGILIKSLEGQTKRAKSSLKDLSDNLSTFGKRMSLFVTGPLAAIGAVGVKGFSGFNDAMTKSLSIMKGVTDEMRERLEGAAKSLAAETVTAPEKLAESFFFLASAGLDAEKSIKALPIVQRFAAAGAFDMALATDLLTDAQTALGSAAIGTTDTIEGLVRISDALALANEQSNASMRQFAEALTADAATAAQSFGADLSTTIAVLAAFAAKGKKGAEAGNLFGRATRLLSGSFIKNRAVFKEFNIEVVDSDRNFRNFIDIVADMERSFEGLGTEQVKTKLALLGFKDLAQKSILPLIGMSKQMRVWEIEQRTAAGTTERIAKKQLESFAAQMKIVSNNVKLAAIDIGGTLAPAILLIGRIVKFAAQTFVGLSSTTKTIIVTFGILLASLGPLAFIVAKSISLWGAFSGSLVGAKVAALGAAAAHRILLLTIDAKFILKAARAWAIFEIQMIAATKGMRILTIAQIALSSAMAPLIIVAAAVAVGFVAFQIAASGLNAALEKSIELSKKTIDGFRKLTSQRIELAIDIEDPGESLEKLKVIQENLGANLVANENALRRIGAFSEKTAGSIKGLIVNTLSFLDFSGTSKAIESALTEAEDRLDSTKESLKEVGVEIKKLASEQEKSADDFAKSLKKEIEELDKTGIELRRMAIDLSALAPEEKKVRIEEIERVLALRNVAVEQSKVRKSINELVTSFEKGAATAGLTKTQIALLAVENSKLGDTFIKTAKDSIEASAALAASRNQSKDLQTEIENLTKSLQDQVAEFGLAGRALEIFRLKNKGATDEMLKGVLAAGKELASKEARKRLEDEGARITSKFTSEVQKFNAEQAKLQELLSQGIINQETFNDAMEAAMESLEGVKKSTDDLIKNKDIKIKVGIEGIEGVEAGTAEAFAGILKLRREAAKRIKLEKPETKGLEGVSKRSAEAARTLSALLKLDKLIKERAAAPELTAPKEIITTIGRTLGGALRGVGLLLSPEAGRMGAKETPEKIAMATAQENRGWQAAVLDALLGIREGVDPENAKPSVLLEEAGLAELG